jgi:hypothetical protein
MVAASGKPSWFAQSTRSADRSIFFFPSNNAAFERSEFTESESAESRYPMEAAYSMGAINYDIVFGIQFLESSLLELSKRNQFAVFNIRDFIFFGLSDIH